jgi:sugar/nucleoside kinase (ribokinase family)
MSILVVGSLAFDTIETPFGKVDNALGGSAVYFSVAASYFTDVFLVGVVGKDFREDHVNVLRERGIDLRGLKQEDGATFHWEGNYGYDLNEAHTLETKLNVFEKFSPHIPGAYRDLEYVFLANIDPELQLRVLKQVRKPKVVALDTMNFWIENKLDALKETIKFVNILIINEAEARELAKEYNLVKAARTISSFGPKTLIIKQGTYGALLFNNSSFFSAPAYPLEVTLDPTGAGDSFAGGFMGYLAKCQNLHDGGIRQAIIFGSVMASFCVEQFSVERLRSLSEQEITSRFNEFLKLTCFKEI